MRVMLDLGDGEGGEEGEGGGGVNLNLKTISYNKWIGATAWMARTVKR